MRWFSRQSFKFKKHDTVQQLEGGYLMVVTGVSKDRSGCIHVTCQWYDRQTKETKNAVFHEKDLQLFDWYHPD